MNDRASYPYYMQDTWEPQHNNFCSYWRVTMFRLVFALLVAVATLLVLTMIGAGIYHDPWTALIIVSSAVGLISVMIGAAAIFTYLDNLKHKHRHEEVPDSLFVAKYKSYKSKVCPIVEYEK